MVDLDGFINYLGEFADFVKGLTILLLHLFDNFKRPVLLAEDPVMPLSVDAFDLQEVVGPSSALNVKADHTLAVLALDASTAILAAAYDALQAESLCVDFGHSDGCLWGHDWTWDPHGTAEVNPLIERLRAWNH